ncbi:hydrogenase maturation protease [Chromobacterium alticapitis]|uniref:Hydrogenase maturation protease n=1 Tax=Chromobacterium alticapitis TaxID=2073169 RepID=A0A2S5DAL6_9NEIS|nr:hydrogenase maturation protease [Chromobacterium alticapitis]POZ60135.1 hypothetical protein C2I19_20470 [Chromobacterium alticapitis]
MRPRASVLVLGFGNPGRGDDAIGPLLIERLQGWLLEQNMAEVEALTDMQLNIEHALDLAGRRRVLFIDAALNGAEPFACAAVTAADDASYTTHAVSPAALLAICERVAGKPAPRAELLAIPGERFGLGEALSAGAAERTERAWVWLLAWCRAAVGQEADHA